MKNKKIILKIFLIIIIILICFAFIYSIFIKNDNAKNLSICEQIKESSNNKESFAVFITDNLEIEGDSNDVVNRYFEAYSNKKDQIYNIDFSSVNNDCLKKYFTELGTYDDLIKNQVNTVMAYKDGVYLGSIINVTDYYYLEAFLNDKKVIEKNVIKEDITISSFEENIKKDKYILVIIAEEYTRDNVLKKVNSVFTDYDIDIINMREGVGEEVYNKINDMTKMNDAYPKIMYFSNNKYIDTVITIDKDEMKTFKEKIEK